MSQPVDETSVIAFLHTSDVHVATFDALRDRLAPDLKLHHEVRADLLQDMTPGGCCAPGFLSGTRAVLTALAEPPTALVLCTCSTLGPLAEAIAEAENLPFLRFDRPMADAAVAQADRIAVMGCLEGAVHATGLLISDAARRAGRQIDLQTCCYPELWDLFCDGALAAYHAAIAEQLAKVAATTDLIVLAQASMAPALMPGTEIPVPVLSSPELGFRAALAKIGYAAHC